MNTLDGKTTMNSNNKLHRHSLLLLGAIGITGLLDALLPTNSEACWVSYYRRVYYKVWYKSWEIVGSHYETRYAYYYYTPEQWRPYKLESNSYYPTTTQTGVPAAQWPTSLNLPVTFLIASKGFWDTVAAEGVVFGEPRLYEFSNNANQGRDSYPSDTSEKHWRWFEQKSLFNAKEPAADMARIKTYQGKNTNLFFTHSGPAPTPPKRYTLGFEMSDYPRDTVLVSFAQENPDTSQDTGGSGKDLQYGVTPPRAAYVYDGKSGNQLDLLKYAVNAPAGYGRGNGGVQYWGDVFLDPGNTIPAKMFTGNYSALKGNTLQNSFDVFYKGRLAPQVHTNTVTANGAVGPDKWDNGLVAPHALPVGSVSAFPKSSFEMPWEEGFHYFLPQSANQTWDPGLYNQPNHLQVGDFDFNYFYRTYTPGALDGAKVLGFNARDTYRSHNRKIYSVIFDNEAPSLTLVKNSAPDNGVRHPEAITSGDYIPAGFGMLPNGTKVGNTKANEFAFPIVDSNRFSWIGATIAGNTDLSNIAKIESAAEGVSMGIEYYDNNPSAPGWKPYPELSSVFLKAPDYIKNRKAVNYAGENSAIYGTQIQNTFMPGDNVRFINPPGSDFDRRQSNSTYDTDRIRVYVKAEDGFSNSTDSRSAGDITGYREVQVLDNDAPNIEASLVTEDKIFSAQVVETVRDPLTAVNDPKSVADNIAIYNFDHNNIDQTNSGKAAQNISGHIGYPSFLKIGNELTSFRNATDKGNNKVKITVVPGSNLKVTVNASDNFWWKSFTGTLTVSGSKGEILKKDYTFAAKTAEEASEEAKQIGGGFPSKKQTERTYRTRWPQEWNGVAPVEPGIYVIAWRAVDGSGNAQSLDFEFEVKEAILERYILESKQKRQ